MLNLSIDANVYMQVLPSAKVNINAICTAVNKRKITLLILQVDWHNQFVMSNGKNKLHRFPAHLSLVHRLQWLSQWARLLQIIWKIPFIQNASVCCRLQHSVNKPLAKNIVRLIEHFSNWMPMSIHIKSLGRFLPWSGWLEWRSL